MEEGQQKGRGTYAVETRKQLGAVQKGELRLIHIQPGEGFLMSQPLQSGL